MKEINEAFEAYGRLDVEDFLPGMLRERLPDYVTVCTRLPDEVTYPLVLVRSAMYTYPWIADRSAVETLDFELHVFASGRDAEAEAMRLSWVVWKIVRDLAAFPINIPGVPKATIAYARMWERPRRRSDWADSTGPVQFQDLPQGVERFLTPCRLLVHHQVAPLEYGHEDFMKFYEQQKKKDG